MSSVAVCASLLAYHIAVTIPYAVGRFQVHAKPGSAAELRSVAGARKARAEKRHDGGSAEPGEGTPATAHRPAGIATRDGATPPPVAAVAACATAHHQPSYELGPLAGDAVQASCISWVAPSAAPTLPTPALDRQQQQFLQFLQLKAMFEPGSGVPPGCALTGLQPPGDAAVLGAAAQGSSLGLGAGSGAWAPAREGPSRSLAATPVALPAAGVAGAFGAAHSSLRAGTSTGPDPHGGALDGPARSDLLLTGLALEHTTMDAGIPASFAPAPSDAAATAAAANATANRVRAQREARKTRGGSVAAADEDYTPTSPMSAAASSPAAPVRAQADLSCLDAAHHAAHCTMHDIACQRLHIDVAPHYRLSLHSAWSPEHNR